MYARNKNINLLFPYPYPNARQIDFSNTELKFLCFVVFLNVLSQHDYVMITTATSLFFVLTTSQQHLRQIRSDQIRSLSQHTFDLSSLIMGEPTTESIIPASEAPKVSVIEPSPAPEEVPVPVPAPAPAEVLTPTHAPIGTPATSCVRSVADAVLQGDIATMKKFIAEGHQPDELDEVLDETPVHVACSKGALK